VRSLPESIRFDRAVEYYDRTRALPDDVVARQASLLMSEMRGASRVLEIGVGTGRIALTLDLPIIGLDLSRPMMDVLLTKSTAVPLIEGDATALPFPDDSFDAAYAAHVLHLIPTWRDALAEMARVVRPGGVVLAVRSSGRTSVETEIFEHASVRRDAVGAGTIDDVDEGAAALGLGVRTLDEIAWSRPVDVGGLIEAIAQRSWSTMWSVDQDTLDRAVEGARAVAIERYGSVDAVVEGRSAFAWHAYDVP